jgi:predicted outer membrane protein
MAVKSQMKVYALHNLPTCVSRLSGLYELAGDREKKEEFDKLYLRTQGEFKPDQIDLIFLNAIETADDALLKELFDAGLLRYARS